MFDPELINQLVQRELQKTKMAEEYAIKPEEQQARPEVKALDPKLAMVLGGAADAASTYGFLKSKKGREGNPAFKYFNGRPWAVIPTAAAIGTGYHYLHKFLKNKNPKVADTMAGLIGGYQAALGGENVEGTLAPKDGGSYRRTVNDLTLNGQ